MTDLPQPPAPGRRTADRVVTTLRPRATSPRPVPEVQGALALDLRDGRPGLPETPDLDPRRTSRLEGAGDTQLRDWAARLAQAMVESLSGQRPVTQLVRWTDPAVYRELQRRAAAAQAAGGPARRPVPAQVRSVHICRPSATTAEVSVHVRHGARSRAVALRLERRRDRWLCTVVQFV